MRGSAKSSLSSSSGSTPTEPPPVPFLSLWRYTTRGERLRVFLGCVAAAVHGALLPVWTVFFGDVITAFGSDGGDVVAAVGDSAKWFLVIGGVAFFAGYFQVQLQMGVAARAGTRMRTLYFRSLMRQDPAWYDAQTGGELTSRVASDVALIQAGMGDKLGSAVQFLTMSLVGFVIAFVYTWKLTAVILSTTPLIGLAGWLVAKVTTESASEGQGAYGAAGAIASEVISLIRTVHAFGGQEEEARRYEKKLDRAYAAGVRKGFFNGLGMGLMNFIMFSSFGLAFWYGTRLRRNGEVEVTDVFVSFFSVLIGSMGLGQAAPSFNAFSVARGAAPRVFEIIDRHSEIDALSSEGDVPARVTGEVAFKDVTFNYASRAEEGVPPVLKSLDLVVRAGSTHALVGASGCGKSSTMALVERFYDPNEGSVSLDGADIRTLNVRWLRAQMGYVGQMPTLFRGTIRENIAFGAAVEFNSEAKDGLLAMEREQVTDRQIIDAAKLANAHVFISRLPEGYDTKLGERGALLSGGQKQRICIARAVVRDPKILLLDEATSALDAQSERTVQEALERASAGRTTIVIAHRLSTVMNADVISVFKDGVVVESGSHNDLVRMSDGVYKHLVELQQVHAADVKESSVEASANQAEGAPAPAVSTSVTGIQVTKGDEGMGEDEEEPDVDPGVVGRTFRLCGGSWAFILVGCFGAILSGAGMPTMALVFSEVTDVLASPAGTGDIVFWSLMFVVVGAVSMAGSVLQYGMLAVSGQRLTRMLRKNSFRALLKQEIAYFDVEENSVGSVTTRLATEASSVTGLCGETLGLASFSISTVLTGVLVSFIGCWRVALIVLSLLPAIVLGGYLEMQMMTGFDSGSKKDYIRSGGLASEAVDNVRTLTSLGIQDEFIERYKESLQAPLRNGLKSAHVVGLAFGFSEFVMFALWGVAFWAGAKFIDQGFCDFLGVMKAVTALLFAGINLGNAAIFAPDVASSKVAATRIYRLLDRQSSIDPTDAMGASLDGFVGGIEASDVKFEYPTRPDVAVLRGLSVAVQPGKTLALCGQSGCGKSTMIALLERFYDVRDGSLTLDKVEVRDANVQKLRSRMALVQQEPDLFNRTVKENIAYGLSKEDGTPVTDEMIVTAAKAANAHDFVSNDLPLGYDTIVGDRGSAMSGGMKQRIAIARALVRHPRVLLLDEATSALDARSERVVQDALDGARSGRTTVVVAHRLSTIKDADAIAVVSKGTVAEIGTHSVLMARGGVYADLVKFQTTNDSELP